MLKILSLSGIPHTDTCTYTDTGTHRQIPFLHFTNLIFGTPHTHKYTQTHAYTETDAIFTFCTLWYTCQRYLAYHRLAHAQTLIHAHT